VFGVCCSGILYCAMWCCGTALTASPAVIEVHGDRTTGEASPLLFGHFIEHEHNTIQGGLWAELLHDRKFEEGDLDRDGVSNGWMPEERITNHYWEVVSGRTRHARYFLDHQECYGGGTAQAIELPDAGGNQASIYQINIPLVKGRR
jgi:hypothetical protein